jgi:hypothetical protein
MTATEGSAALLDAPAAPPTPEPYRLLGDCRAKSLVLTGPGGMNAPVQQTGNNPPIVVDPRVRGGRPTSVFDLLYEQKTGKKLRRDQHAAALTAEGEATFDCSLFSMTDGTVVVLGNAAVHKMLGGKAHYTLDTARTAKQLYFDRKRAVIQIASESLGLSRGQIRDLIAGKTFWYA